MRVAVSSFRFNQEGGIERVSYELAKRLAPDVDMTLFATAVEPEPVAPLKWRQVPTPASPASLVPLTYSRAATRAIRPGRFDIVHNQGGCAAREQDIITAHSCHAAWWNMKFREGETLRAIANPFHHAVLHVERRNYAPGAFRRAIAVSPSVARELSEFYGVDPDLIRVIPNAVDLERFRPSADARREDIRTRHRFADSDFVLLFVGKEFRRKGLRAIIDALVELPDTVKLLVVGGDDPTPFRRHALGLGVGARVVFAGHAAEVEDYYQAGDAFVFPTIYEAFGLVMLEAAACGLPVFATRLGVAEELISDGANGGFIERDGASIAQAIRPLVSDPDLRRRMGADAERSARQYPSWDEVTRRTLDLYAEVADEKRREGYVSA
ncbi:glycosyltransferase family 4 protein [uncultured Microbacterium sp.]|uniref:glycosyltransferase family 4 protein n=1 Tax=uncultured Microbacterium sp. TaxID=191216 RepID=UPI0026163124|nr:glycosyltransferase family 4 protein [uncultured Microbacterium sp.]